MKKNELAPVIEAAAMRETEDALREFMRVAHNAGLSNTALAIMLRVVADEIDSPPPSSTLIQ